MARRWPSYIAGLIAAALVLIVLPNGFRIPNQNPTASAEYAPVPGRSQSSDASNFSETKAPTSSGIGSGGEGEGILPGLPLPPIQQFDPANRECVYVDGVARQTEDPLSPPCVSYFEGENGGATFQGVTEDAIKVILYNDRCCDGSLNEPYKPSDEKQCNSTFPEECDHTVRTVKAMLRYFNHRYQTYGRTVEMFAQKTTGAGGIGAACSVRTSDAQNALSDHHPFAAVSFSQGGQNCYIREMAESHVPVFGLNEDAEISIYRDYRPYAFGFLPPQEVQVAWSASFLCRKLNERKAIHAGDPLMHTAQRTFGFIRPNGDSRGTELRLQADLLPIEMRRQCGMEFDLTERFEAGAGGGAEEAAGILSKFKQQGITTVVCYCIPRQTELTAPTMLNAATSIEYFPEWYWDAASQMERATWQRQYGSPAQKGFGATYWWRAPAFRQQVHYQAYLREEPGTAPAAYWNAKLYYLFLNLFSAIQAAGPNLTPETVEKGMFTFNYLDRDTPWVPTGGFGNYNADAVSDYTFLDTAMAVTWDPAGTAPGGLRGEGCMRVANEGLRVYAGEWPETDEDLYRPGDPCTADLYKDRDPGT